MKKVGTAMYVHKSNLNELIKKISKEEANRIQNIINNFNKNFEVIKYDKGKLSLIESENWNQANEPDVGNSYCFSTEATSSDDFKLIKKSDKIYHNKWMFVSEDYNGFDVSESKKRTVIWNSIPNIKEHKKRIGNKNYWESLLNQNNIPL